MQHVKRSGIHNIYIYIYIYIYTYIYESYKSICYIVSEVGAVVVRPVSLGVEAVVVMSDTSYGIHSGLVCGSTSLQAGDSTRGLGEDGVKAKVSLLSPGSVVGVSLLLAGDRTFQKCGWIYNCSPIHHGMQFKQPLKIHKNIIFITTFYPNTALPQLVNFVLVLVL